MSNICRICENCNSTETVYLPKVGNFGLCDDDDCQWLANHWDGTNLLELKNYLEGEGHCYCVELDQKHADRLCSVCWNAP